MENQQDKAPRLNHNGKDSFWYVKFGTPEYDGAFKSRQECLDDLERIQNATK